MIRRSVRSGPMMAMLTWPLLSSLKFLKLGWFIMMVWMLVSSAVACRRVGAKQAILMSDTEKHSAVASCATPMVLPNLRCEQCQSELAPVRRIRIAHHTVVGKSQLLSHTNHRRKWREVATIRTLLYAHINGTYCSECQRRERCGSRTRTSFHAVRRMTSMRR